MKYYLFLHLVLRDGLPDNVGLRDPLRPEPGERPHSASFSHLGSHLLVLLSDDGSVRVLQLFQTGHGAENTLEQ